VAPGQLALRGSGAKVKLLKIKRFLGHFVVLLCFFCDKMFPVWSNSRVGVGFCGMGDFNDIVGQ
jgi:hypothetical protein